jgi:hypothetical protein
MNGYWTVPVHEKMSCEQTIMKTMPTKTLKALKASIRHWERMRKDPSSEKPTADNCSLCMLFNSYKTEGELRCVGCPVSEFANAELCLNTPFQSAHDAYAYARELRDSKAPLAAWRKAAAAEIKFLKSLLPK